MAMGIEVTHQMTSEDSHDFKRSDKRPTQKRGFSKDRPYGNRTGGRDRRISETERDPATTDRASARMGRGDADPVPTTGTARDARTGRVPTGLMTNALSVPRDPN